MNDDEFEDIRKLMRLKRHETPGENFTEDFLRTFHQRQREIAQRQSGLDRFLEQLGMKFEAFLNPKWGIAAAAAVIALVALFLNGINGAGPQADQAAQIAAEAKAAEAKKKAQNEQNTLENKPSGIAIPASHQEAPEKAKDPR